MIPLLVVYYSMANSRGGHLKGITTSVEVALVNYQIQDATPKVIRVVTISIKIP